MKKITVIGGGTGTYIVLSGLKSYPVSLSAIVSMMDSGGSTGRLRDQLGVLPPGDLRQSLVALSEASLLWRELFLYRFESGDLAGHNFGNIFLSALEKVSKNYQQVIQTASYILKTKGKVIPVTFEKTHLVAKYKSGNVLKGEGKIDTNVQERTRIEQVLLEPTVKANPEAEKAILGSDWLVIGPGDLYTSIIPILLVKNIKQAIDKTKAKIIYILNLMTKSGQTNNYSAYDHLDDLEQYLGKKPQIVLVNNGRISKNIIEWYNKHKERSVKNDLSKTNFPGKVISSNLINSAVFEKNQADRLARSVLRHDPKKLAKIIFELI